MKHVYERALCTLLLCIGLVYGAGATASAESKDSYRVYIQNDTGGDIFYSFKKTSTTGKIIPNQKGRSNYDRFGKEESRLKTISESDFPALIRSKKTTERTTLFVSESPSALTAVLGGTANKDQKDIVFSRNVPAKMGAACSGYITFVVTKKSRMVLSIQAEDNRTC